MKTIKKLKHEIEELLLLHQVSDITVNEVLEKFKDFENPLRERYELAIKKIRELQKLMVDSKASRKQVLKYEREALALLPKLFVSIKEIM